MNTRNLVDLLTTHDPMALRELRTNFPSATSIWRRDRDMGPSTPAGDVPPEAALQLATVGIETLRKRADVILVELTERMKRVQKLKTVSSGISAIASAGLLGSVAKVLDFGNNSLALGLAITTFVSSLLSIFSEQAAGGANGGQVREYFEKTIALSSRVLRTDLKRKRMDINSIGVSELGVLLSDLDEIALELHDVELKLRVL